MISTMRGVWIDVDVDASACIARWGNKAFRDFVSAASPAPYLQGTDMEPEFVEEDVCMEATARHILLGIRGTWQESLGDGEFVDIEYNARNMLRLFRELPEFYALIVNAAKELESYRQAFMDRTTENLVAYANWQVRWGGQTAKLQQVKDAGGDPPALRNKPELDDYELSVMWHFRTIGESVKYPFPFSEMEAYCRLQGIEDFDDREELLTYMVRIGSAMVREQGEVDKQKEELESYRSGSTDGAGLG